MDSKKNRSFISRLGLFDRYNLSFILSSLIPLGVLVLIVHKYVIPDLERAKADPSLIFSLSILMYLLVFLAILAFFVSRSATRETVETLRVNNEKLNSIFTVSESLSREVHLDVLLTAVVRRSMELTNADGGLVLIRDEETGDLVIEIAEGTGPVTVRSVPYNSGVAGWVARHQKVALINDVTADPRYNAGMDILPSFDTGSILASPLVSGSRSFGTLELLKKSGQPGFSEGDASLLKSMAGQTSIFIQNVEYREEQQNYFTHMTELLLSALDGTRQFWPGHLNNTARYTYLLAKHLGLPDGQLKKLHYAALFHDIGFVKLNLREGPPRKLIELHPEMGYEMLRPITVWKDVAPLVRYHHERYDGEGYPHQLGGREIPVGSRILSVAEALDTMVNPKSYKKQTMEIQDAVQEIRAYAGTQFDPRVVDALVELLETGYLTPEG
ncbi:MAG TPA: HD domain-containing phosphohydrolase [bacterium]|nr:HD domain-containing phosphohydrolase [bacterium]